MVPQISAPGAPGGPIVFVRRRNGLYVVTDYANNIEQGTRAVRYVDGVEVWSGPVHTGSGARMKARHDLWDYKAEPEATS